MSHPPTQHNYLLPNFPATGNSAVINIVGEFEKHIHSHVQNPIPENRESETDSEFGTSIKKDQPIAIMNLTTYEISVCDIASLKQIFLKYT